MPPGECHHLNAMEKYREVVGLTRHQSAVASLVASGLSNNEIAVALGISVKTVEYHLGRVYSKLEVRSRTQLTRRMIEREPEPLQTQD
jgi:DNA-binding NarL/FixJ family response regulator